MLEFLPILLSGVGVALISGLFMLIQTKWKNKHEKETNEQRLEKLLTSIKDNMETQDKAIHQKIDILTQELVKVMDAANLLKEGQINLLRDQLAEGYHKYKNGCGANSYISAAEYRALCDTYEIYKRHGGNSYADQLMNNIHELYKQQPKREGTN